MIAWMLCLSFVAPNPVAMQWKLEPGDVFRIESVEKQKQKVATAGKIIESEHVVTAILKVQVDKKLPAGSLVQLQFESVKVESRERSAAEDEMIRLMTGATFKAVVTPQGQIVRFEDYDAFIKKLTQGRPASEKLLRSLLSEESLKMDLGSHLSFLPPGPVAVGDRWKRDGRIPLGPLGSFAAINNYHYEGKLEEKEAIAWTASLSYQRPKDSGELFKIVKGDLQARRATGVFVFDAVNGRLVRADRSIEVSGALTIDVAGNQVAMKLDLQQANSVRILPH